MRGTLIKVGTTAMLAAVALVAVTSIAQTGNQAGRDWAYHQGDPGGTRFSTLTQINTSNVTTLSAPGRSTPESGRFASSPMVVDSVMYFSAPNGVYAVDAVTGTQIWKYAPAVPPRHRRPPAAAPAAGAAEARLRGRSRRLEPAGGWSDAAARAADVATADAAEAPTRRHGAPRTGVLARQRTASAPRIYSTTTPGLAAIDAKTGTLVPTFGENGILPRHPTELAARDLQERPHHRRRRRAGKGDTVKGFDVVTGQQRWTFYLKAQPGDPNRATWLNGSADTERDARTSGACSRVDERARHGVHSGREGRGNGNNDYWGGGNHGNNLYSDSLVALDAMTGKMKWYQQLVHHDIWDYDIAAAPVLIDVRRNGQVIPAVAQTDEDGLMFIFNRETGEPIFGVEERPVPQTTRPGEWTSPTQPFPVKPRAAGAQFVQAVGAREGDAGASGVLREPLGHERAERRRAL